MRMKKKQNTRPQNELADAHARAQNNEPRTAAEFLAAAEAEQQRGLLLLALSCQLSQRFGGLMSKPEPLRLLDGKVVEVRAGVGWALSNELSTAAIHSATRCRALFDASQALAGDAPRASRPRARARTREG